MVKEIIFCEVTCGKCGTVANFSGYYSPARIKKLKQETKAWVSDDNYRVLCPHCQIKIKEQNNIKKG